MIQCEKLSKNFKVYRQRRNFQGLSGTLQSFFKRESYINPAVKDFDLNLDTHKMVGLLGPNGSGKTTLMKMFYRNHFLQAEVSVRGFGGNPRSEEKYF